MSSGSDDSPIIISAYNVHGGGGAVLLEALLRDSPAQTITLLDARFKNSTLSKVQNVSYAFSPTLLGRLKAEALLRFHINQNYPLLCFGNIPPLFRHKGRTTLFLQNALLLKQVKLSMFPIKTRLRLIAERTLLHLLRSHLDRVLVQTQTMKRHADAFFDGKVLVEIAPIAPPNSIHLSASPSDDFQFDFIYPASGDAHKNHIRLIEAWRLLAKEGLFPKLALTIDPLVYAELHTLMESSIQRDRLNIFNFQKLDRESLLKHFAASRALVFPSLCESFGLPLLEAAQLNRPIVASELDYVRDVCTPIETFDPLSPYSIAAAIKRALKIPFKTAPILPAKAFLEYLK